MSVSLQNSNYTGTTRMNQLWTTTSVMNGYSWKNYSVDIGQKPAGYQVRRCPFVFSQIAQRQWCMNETLVGNYWHKSFSYMRKTVRLSYLVLSNFKQSWFRYQSRGKMTYLFENLPKYQLTISMLKISGCTSKYSDIWIAVRCCLWWCSLP